METRLPTREEIAELVAFLPRLSADDFAAMREWSSPRRPDVLPYPEYDPLVVRFFETASKECWCDHGYQLEGARQMLENEDGIRTADLRQIRTMLTFCTRGERFVDGHWAAMIREGHIRRLLERLAEIGE